VDCFPSERWVGEGDYAGEDFSEARWDAVEQLVAAPCYPG
jgi:hypothetical protein